MVFCVTIHDFHRLFLSDKKKREINLSGWITRFWKWINWLCWSETEKMKLIRNKPIVSVLNNVSVFHLSSVRIQQICWSKKSSFGHALKVSNRRNRSRVWTFWGLASRDWNMPRKCDQETKWTLNCDQTKLTTHFRSSRRAQNQMMRIWLFNYSLSDHWIKNNSRFQITIFLISRF